VDAAYSTPFVAPLMLATIPIILTRSTQKPFGPPDSHLHPLDAHIISHRVVNALVNPAASSSFWDLRAACCNIIINLSILRFCSSAPLDWISRKRKQREA
jgi:hypothetical protein